MLGSLLAQLCKTHTNEQWQQGKSQKVLIVLCQSEKILDLFFSLHFKHLLYSSFHGLVKNEYIFPVTLPHAPIYSRVLSSPPHLSLCIHHRYTRNYRNVYLFVVFNNINVIILRASFCNFLFPLKRGLRKRTFCIRRPVSTWCVNS